MMGPTAQEYHERKLAEFKERWDAGHWNALHDAVRFCQTLDLLLPRWVARAVLNIIQNHYHDGARGRDGAHGSIKGRVTMDYAHYRRWCALRRVLQVHGLKELPTRRGRPREGALTAKSLLDEASNALGVERAQPREIADSFRLVEKSRAVGEARFKFEPVI
jgi:hypothetical protein